MRRWLAHALLAAGTLAVAAAWVVLAVPLHGSGVSGTAFRPHYRSAATPVPSTSANPQDVVVGRRHDAAVLAACGGLGLGVGLLLRRRRLRPTPAAG